MIITAIMADKIKEMIEDGFAKKRVAKILQIPDDEIKEIVNNNCWKLKQEIFSDDQIPRICDLYEQKVSAKSLGKKFSIDKRRVQKWADEKGFLRDRYAAGRFTEFDQHKFDQVDTIEKAYWLGFCYADAYNSQSVGTFSLTLATKDLNHVEKFTKFMDMPLDQIVTEKGKQGGKNGELWASNISFHSKHLCTQMAANGCPQAKSFIIKYPEWLDKSLNVHFLRGMFDGDGCLTVRVKSKEWKWSVVSTKECLEVISNIIEENVGIKINYECISQTDNNTYCMECTGNERIKTLCDWLWADSDPLSRLDRKYQKYLDLTEQQNNRNFLKLTNRTTYFLPKNA